MENTSSGTGSVSAVPLQPSVQQISAIPVEPTGMWWRTLPAPVSPTAEMVVASELQRKVLEWGIAEDNARISSWQTARTNYLAGKDPLGNTCDPMDIGPLIPYKLAPMNNIPASTSGVLLTVDTRNGPVNLTGPPTPPGFR